MARTVGMKATNIGIACLLVVATTLSQADALSAEPEQRGVYEVSFGGNSRHKVEVNGWFEIDNPYLEMSDYGAWSQETGWATFVSELTVTDSRGKAVDFEKSDRLQWRLHGVERGDQISVSYSVDISLAASRRWQDGPKTTAAFDDGAAISLLTGMLFIAPQGEMHYSVKLKVRKGWRATTSWPLDQTQNSYSVESTESLTTNMLVVGAHDVSELDVGGFSVRMVALGMDTSPLPLLAPVVETTLERFIFLMRDGSENVHLMVWIKDPTFFTGEAYENSYIVSTTSEITQRNSLDWSKTIAHELFHIWMGREVRMADWASGQWLSEGFTEYVAIGALAHSGILETKDVLRLMEMHSLLYMRFRYRWGTPYEPLSLVEAGSNKSQYNVAIYNGGWVAALCIDILMREATDGEIGLPNLVRALFDAAQKGRRDFSNESVMALAEEMTDAKISEFCESYISGSAMIPLQAILNRAGFDAIANSRLVDIRIDSDAPSSETRIRNAIVGR